MIEAAKPISVGGLYPVNFRWLILANRFIPVCFGWLSGNSISRETGVYV